MVKLKLVKRDFVWIGLIVVLLIVGFGYAYGGTTPAVMGHTGGEIVSVDWSQITNKPAETDPTVLASVKNGVSWAEVSGKPAGFADNVDNTADFIVYTKSCSGLNSCTVTCNAGDVRTGCSSDTNAPYTDGGGQVHIAALPADNGCTCIAVNAVTGGGTVNACYAYCTSF